MKVSELYREDKKDHREVTAKSTPTNKGGLLYEISNTVNGTGSYGTDTGTCVNNLISKATTDPQRIGKHTRCDTHHTTG
jgi:hypothetical protein